jgi:hypothetical protein
MTEEEWLKGPAAWLMLEFLRGTRQGRKLRLFACACCRRVWDHLTDVRTRTAVEALELEADDPRSSFQLNPEASFRAAAGASQAAAAAVASRADPVLASRHAAWAVLRAAEDVTIVPALTSLSKAISAAGRVVEATEGHWGGPTPSALDGGELMAQSDLLLDIFGNPFRRSLVDARWLTWNDATVPRLARGIYEDRRLEMLPILGDALEEAGCGDADMLAHCRRPALHVRGC